jgi:outer membrane lipoprotein-sorting protein
MRRKFYLSLILIAVIGFMGAASCRRADEKEQTNTESGKQAPSEKAAPEEPARPGKASPGSGDEKVDAILAKYFDALGGRARWNEVKTLKYTGKMNSMGKFFQMAIVYKRPDKCRIDFSLGHIYFIQSYDGKEAWKYNPTTQGSTPEVLDGEDEASLIETCDFDGPLVDPGSKGIKVELMGKEKIDGREAYNLKVTFKSGNVDNYYLDAKTYLPFMVKGTTKQEGKVLPSTTVIDQYIDTGGVMIPYYFKFDAEGGADSEIIKVSTVEINPELEDSVFTFPRRIEDSY